MFERMRRERFGTYILLAVLLAAVAGVSAWTLVLRAPARPPVPIERKLMEQRPRPLAPEILRVPPREMRAVVRSDALLRPDRRFVLAFEDVAAFEDTRSEGGANVSSRNRRWTIDAGGGIRAELSDVPGFFETLDALRKAAGARVPAGGKKLAASESLRLRTLAADPFEESPIRALREIETRWSAGFDRRELLDLGSVAFATLQLEAVDPLELSDDVGGRALALLALAEAASGTRFPAREALLAYALGYAGEARGVARDLPEAESIRPFLLGADGELEAVAESTGAPPLARYLYVIRLAPRADVAGVFEWLGRHGSPRADDPASTAAALLARDSFDHRLGLNATLMMAGWAEAGGKGERPGPGFLASFERNLAARKPEKGRFLEEAVVVSRIRTLFYSGLFGIGSFYLDSLGSGPAAQGFADYLTGAEPGPGADFRRWYGNLAAESNGGIPASRLVDDLTSLPSLGQGALRRTGTRLENALYATSSARPKAAAALERVLDSRAANDYLFGAFCQNTLMHPVAFERYYRASMERVSLETTGPNLWFAYLARDTATLTRVAADPGADPERRVLAVSYLDDLEALAVAEVGTLVRAILARTPKDLTAMKCVRRLWENGFLDDGEAFLRGWLAAHPDEHVLTRALYASRLEHVLFLGGRFDDAWRAIEPYVPTGKADALFGGAEALEGLGRHDEALAMSAGALERYPDDNWSRSAHAQLLWRQGRFDEVGKILLDPKYPIDPKRWGEVVARDFYDVFARKGPSETRKAFEALVRANVNPWFLFTLADRFAARKQYDIAIDLLHAVARSKNEGIDGNLREYRFRIQRDGHEGANRWFRSEVARSASASWVGQKAFDVHEFELLWLLPDSDEHWMLRAQAAAFEGGAAGERSAALVAHFRDPKTRPTDALDGLFLLGLETEDRLFESATSADRRCDVAFVLGLKAIGEKRLEDACDWLRVCQRIGSSARPSYKSAEGLLKYWDVRRFGRRGGRDIP